MKTKLCALVAGTSLLFSQTCFCNNPQTEATGNAKYKKHLAIGAYSILGLYSAKKTIEATIGLGISTLLLATSEVRIMGIFLFLLYLAKFSGFGYLTHFSLKNIIAESKKIS